MGQAFLHLALAQTGDVRIRIYSIGFRKIQDIDLGPLSEGTHDLPLALQDKMGAPLANGLYYLVIDAGGDRKTLKWLIFR